MIEYQKVCPVVMRNYFRICRAFFGRAFVMTEKVICYIWRIWKRKIIIQRNEVFPAAQYPPMLDVNYTRRAVSWWKTFSRFLYLFEMFNLIKSKCSRLISK